MADKLDNAHKEKLALEVSVAKKPRLESPKEILKEIFVDLEEFEKGPEEESTKMEVVMSETVEGQGSGHVGHNHNHQLESVLIRMIDYLEKQENRETEVLDDIAFERFQNFRLSKFNGEVGVEVAEKWIEAMENIYEVLKYSDERKVTFGKFQLEGLANEWWRVIEEKWAQEGKPCTWNAFVGEFKRKFIPLVFRERKEEEFIGLRQKTQTVAQYEMQFTKLSKYAPNMVNTEAKRMRHFLLGLNKEIRDALLSAEMDTYADVVDYAQRVEETQAKLKEFQSKKSSLKNWVNAKGSSSQGQAKQPQKGSRKFPQKRPSEIGASMPAKRGTPQTLCSFCGKSNHSENQCWKKAGKCLRCGSPEHKIKNCPSIQQGTTKPAASAPFQPEKQGIAEKSKVPARVYAIDKNDVDSVVDVVEEHGNSEQEIDE